MELPDGQDQFKLNEVCKLANVQPYMFASGAPSFLSLRHPGRAPGSGSTAASRSS